MICTKSHLDFAKKNALISFGYCALFCVGVYGVDYTNSTLPSTITLNGGLRQDTITSTRGNGQATTIGYGRNPHLSINGAAGSQYALQANDNTTTFYSGGFSVSGGVQTALMGIHTLAVESGSVSVGSGATFNVISSGNTINAQGSEYGGESKVHFERGTSLSLSQNAKADFSNANFFIHSGSTAISQGANLTISATTIRLQNEFTNNGGSVTLTGNVYNVGFPIGLRNNTTSTLTINGGSVSINGNFYNGAESKDMSVDNTGGGGLLNVYDPAFGGGGNLTIYGGSMSVSGTLISQMGGDSINGGGISNPRNSAVSIYGGTLSATGGVQNLSGSTLTIGAHNGKMGQIVGNVVNQGNFIIDAQGANAGNHTLITGNLSGNALSLKNGNTEFATANLAGKELTVNLITDKIASFTSSLTSNQKSTINALGNQIYTTNGATSPRLAQSADLLNQSAFTLISAPFSLIATLKSSLAYPVSYLNNTSKISSKTNSLEISFIGGILQSSSKLSGGSGGIRMGYAKDFASYFGGLRLEIIAGYVYNAMKDNATSTLLSYSSSLTSHTAGAEAIFSTALSRDSRLGLKVGLGGFVSFIDSSREVDTTLLRANPSLKSSLSLYQIALDSSVGYEVLQLSNFTATPYLGLHQSVNILPSFAESNQNPSTLQSISIALKTQGYKAYHLGLIVGLEARLRLKEMGKASLSSTTKTQEAEKGILLGKIEYEYLAFHSQKSIVLAYSSTDSISLAPPHSHKVRGALGFQKNFTNGVTLGVEAQIQSLISTQSISKTLGQSLYFYGASATVGYRF